jgi:branched-chain amino acid transport system permease protein
VQLFIQQLINGIGQGALIALFAVGFNMLFSALGILNIAQGTIATFGAIACFYTVTDAGVPLWLGALLGAVAGGLLGVIVDAICFAPIRDRAIEAAGLPGMSTLITSMGAWIALLALAQLIVGPVGQGFSTDILPDEAILVGGIRILPMTIINVASALIIGAAMSYMLARTKLGATARAIGFRRQSIVITGSNTTLWIVVLSFIGCAVTGLAGSLAGITYNAITFDIGDALMFSGFAAVVLGGMGSTAGAMTGGFLLGVIQVMSAQYVSSSFRDAITYGLLLVVLIALPRGLFGKASAARA